MVELTKLRNFIKDKTSFALKDIFVGRVYDDKKEVILLTFLTNNQQEITFDTPASYGEITLNVKYNGSENYKTSFQKANEIFNAFKDNRSDNDNDIRLFIPQQPTLIGKIKGIYKYEIIVQIKFDY